MPPSANLAFIATKATLFGGLRRADFQTGPLPAASRSRADTGPTRPCRSAWLSRGAGPAAGPPSGRARELEPRRRDRSPNGTRTGRGCLDGSFGLDLEAAVRAGPAGSCAFRGVGVRPRCNRLRSLARPSRAPHRRLQRLTVLRREAMRKRHQAGLGRHAHLHPGRDRLFRDRLGRLRKDTEAELGEPGRWGSPSHSSSRGA